MRGTFVQHLNRLMGGTGRRGILTLAGGTSLSQAVLVVTAPILTRIYSPGAFGIYSGAIAILAVLMTVSCLSYQNAIGLPDDDVGAANVLALCFVITLAACVVTGVVLVVGGDQVLSVFGLTALASSSWLLLVGQFAGSVHYALVMWATRVEKYAAVAGSGLTNSGITVMSQIGLGLVRSSTFSLLAGYVIGTLAASAHILVLTWRSRAAAFRGVSGQGIVAAARRYRRFPILSTPASLLNTLGVWAPLLMLMAIFGPTIGGEFALAYRIVFLPVTIVSQAVGRVFYAQAAPMARVDPLGLRRLYAKTTKGLAAGAMAPALVGMLAAPLFIGAIFGHEWAEAGAFVAVLVPWSYVVFVTTPTGAALDVLERQDLYLIREMGRLVVLGLTAAATIVADLEPLAAVALLSAVGCLNYAWYAFLTFRSIAAIRLEPAASAAMPLQATQDDGGDRTSE